MMNTSFTIFSDRKPSLIAVLDDFSSVTAVNIPDTNVYWGTIEIRDTGFYCLKILIATLATSVG